MAFVVGQRKNEATNRCTRFVENQSEWHNSEDIHRLHTNFHPIARLATSLPDAALVEKEWNLILQGSMTVRFHFVVLGSFQLQFLFRQFAMAFRVWHVIEVWETALFLLRYLERKVLPGGKCVELLGAWNLKSWGMYWMKSYPVM